MDDLRSGALAEGAYLHDVGKVGIPDHVLNKPEPSPTGAGLDPGAPDRRHRHRRARPSLREALKVIRQHHERYDGGGYLDGLAGDEISLAARTRARRGRRLGRAHLRPRLLAGVAARPRPAPPRCRPLNRRRAGRQVPTGPRWRSLSGLTMERTVWTRPSAMSRARTPRRRPSGSMASRPGWPLTSAGRTRIPAAVPRRLRPRRTRATPTAPWTGWPGRGSAAAVAVHHDVVGQQPDQALGVALLDRGEEPPGQLLALSPGRLEPGAAWPRRGGGPWRRSGAVVLRTCRPARRSRRSRSRTPRGAGTPPAGAVRGAPAGPGRPATGCRRSRRGSPGPPPRRSPAAPEASRRRSVRAAPGPSAGGRWRAGS